MCFWNIRRVYLRAKASRKKSNHTQLLLSHIESHSLVKICTLFRWICQVLKYAGINTKIFTSHSVRVTSILKAKTLLYLSARFSNRVNGPKNQQGKNSIEFSIRSTEVLSIKIEYYNKARSACIVIEVLWIKLRYDLILPSQSNPLHSLSFCFFSCLGSKY